MKKQLILLISLLPLLSFAQCPPGSVSLTNQADVDEFVANFPDCDQIDGNLLIGSSFISSAAPPMDLSGLSSLTQVTGTLFLRKTEGLDEEDNAIPGSLEGLENILSVRSLLIGRPVSSGGTVHRYESLDPLNGLSGKVDSLFIETVYPDSELPPFENLTGIGYYRQDLLLGVTSSPTFPNLTYLGDMTIAGGNGLFNEDVMLTTVVIPSQLDSISTVQGEFNFPFGGFFIFDNTTVSEVIGGENLTYLQDVSISNNLVLEDLSAFSNVNSIGFGGLGITSEVPGIFDSFQSLQSLGTDSEVSLSFFDNPEDCMQPTDELVIGLSSQVSGDEISPFSLDVTANCVENITVTGNFSKLAELNFTALDAINISGFGELDSITESRLQMNTPKISQLPDFENLVHVEQDLLLRINGGDWLLENLSGLDALISVGGDLRIGFGGSAGGSFFTSLTGLESLTTVDGRVEISRLEALTDASALNNLVSADQILFERLESLNVPPAMSNLTAVGDVRIDETGLTSLPEFTSLTSMIGDLRVQDNSALTAINGFVSLEELEGNISIEGNPQLTEVALPEDLVFEGELSVMNNPLLADCGTSVSFCNLVTQANLFELMANGAECTLPGDVLLSCQSLSTNDVDDRKTLRVGMGEEFLSIISSHQFENGRVNMYSAEGKRVFSQSASLQSGENRFQIPELSTGVYILSFENGEHFHRSKVFVGER